MTRLTRAESQRVTRARVLAAARAEFAERGYTDAKIDRIADRAGLTRGAVYSNFPGKRALLYTTLADAFAQPPTAARSAGTSSGEPPTAPGGGPPGRPGSGPTEGWPPGEVEAGRTGGGDASGVESGDLSGVGGVISRPGNQASEALAAFATAWLDHPEPLRELLVSGLVPEILADADASKQYAQLLNLSAILLGLALEQQTGTEQVRVARLVLANLHGADQLLTSAPGFLQPLDVIRGCAELTQLNLPAAWQPPPTSPPVRPDNAELPWDDGLLLVLGLNRLQAVEDAARAAPGIPIDVGIVSSRPTELGPLARLVLGRTQACLLRSFSTLPPIRLHHDETGELADLLGLDTIGNDLEYAARIHTGRVITRANGPGATHAVAARSDHAQPDPHHQPTNNHPRQPAAARPHPPRPGG